MESIGNTNMSALENAGHHTGVNRFSLLGMAVAGLGTFLAVQFVPDDPSRKGALFVSALVMAFGLAAVPLVNAFRYPKSLLRSEHIIVMGPIYWLLLDLLQGTYGLNEIYPEQVGKAFVAIGMFVVAVWAGVLGPAWKLPRMFVKSVSHDFSVNTNFLVCITAFVLGMLTFAIPAKFNVVEMIYYLGENRWAAPWVRGQLGGWDAFADQLQYFGYLLPVLTVIIGRRAGWVDVRTIASGAMTVVMMMFLAQGGARRIIGVTWGMALIVWLLTEKRVRIKQMLVAAGAVVMLLLTLQIMLQYRTSGLAAMVEGKSYEPFGHQESIRVDDNFYRLCQLIELIPQFYPHTYLNYVVWVIVRPIPRVFWPGKPVDPGFDLPSALGMQGISLSSSVVGELYMAAGFLGIALGGWFYGKLAAMATRLVTLRPTFGGLMIYAILTMSLFAGERSMLDLVLINYALVAWTVLSRMLTYLTGESAS